MEISKLRELLMATHGNQAMIYNDLFALGCWLHLNGERSVGEKLITEVTKSVPESGNRTYLQDIRSRVAGNEREWAYEIHAHLEINELFRGEHQG